jgi:hypothetical protein
LLGTQALIEFFGTLSSDWALECLKELLVSNMAQNLQLVVNIAKEYTEQLTPGKIIELFEAYNSYHGLYFYLGSRIAFTEVRQACCQHNPWAVSAQEWRSTCGGIPMLHANRSLTVSHYISFSSCTGVCGRLGVLVGALASTRNSATWTSTKF